MLGKGKRKVLQTERNNLAYPRSFSSLGSLELLNIKVWELSQRRWRRVGGSRTQRAGYPVLKSLVLILEQQGS